MKVSSSIRVLRSQLAGWRREGRRIAFVPTMGFLHDGHLRLIRRARRLVGNRGRVVVSIYVNPTQFGPGEDLSRYPRDRAGDLRLCREGSVDVVFLPSDAVMYPGRSTGDFTTFVVEESLSQSMEGAARPGHFRGVTTVVAKLFNIVGPDVAVFGAKDWQQAAVVRRMVDNLNMPVRVCVEPTARAADGLALSSRNKYLTPGERNQATCLWRAIQEARRVVRTASGGRVGAARLKARVHALIEAQPDARLEYVEWFDARTLEPVRRVRQGCHMALAVFVGRTRLIDNGKL